MRPLGDLVGLSIPISENLVCPRPDWEGKVDDVTRIEAADWQHSSALKENAYR